MMIVMIGDKVKRCTELKPKLLQCRYKEEVGGHTLDAAVSSVQSGPA